MVKTVGWGILGAGKFAREHMGPAIHAARGARLAAIGTSSPEKAAPFLDFAPDMAVHDTYEAVLADKDVDAVYIPLPNHLHIEWATRALQAGKHVLCEKPIALKASDIDPLITLCDQTGLVCAEAYMIVHHPQWARLRHLIKDGAIGALRHVNGVFTYNNPDKTNVRFDKSMGGGGLPDVGVYTIGSTRWATGAEPREITCADIDFEGGVDVIARTSARFDGFTATWINAMAIHLTQEMTFLGTEGRIRLTAPFNPGVYAEGRLELTQADGTTRTEHWPNVNQYVLQVEAFGRSIREGAAYPWTLGDARGTQAVIDAVYAKAQAG